MRGIKSIFPPSFVIGAEKIGPEHKDWLMNGLGKKLKKGEKAEPVFPVYRLKELSEAELEDLADRFRRDLFLKAGKTPLEKVRDLSV